MAYPTSDKNQNLADDKYDFSLVLGGPLYQLLRRSRLADDALAMVHRRMLLFSILTWAPLLILSWIDGHALKGAVPPFLYDVDSHCRYLVALPLLIYAELVVHRRMRGVVRQFLDRDLIPESQMDRFFGIVRSAGRLRNSLIAEILLIAFVYGVGIPFVWRNIGAVNASTWYSAPAEGGGRPLAGLWLTYVSLPVFQFILFRWYFRLVIWTRFLWQISRLDLRLVPTHPDLSGGLGFLAGIVFAYVPLLMAQGVLFSGAIANFIFYEGGKLPQYKLEIIAAVAASLFLVLGPLLVFVGRLSAARRKGLVEYGVLAQRYVKEFDHKWLRGGAAEGEPFIGSADIQSLADLSNSYDVIRRMNIVPFTKETIFKLAVITLLPILPLTLTMFSLEQLIERILKSVF